MTYPQVTYSTPLNQRRSAMQPVDAHLQCERPSDIIDVSFVEVIAEPTPSDPCAATLAELTHERYK